MKTLLNTRVARNFLAQMYAENSEEEYETDEFGILSDVFRLEEQLYVGSRTYLYGDVSLRIEGKTVRCKRKGRLAVELPRWVEPDSVRVVDCGVQGVLLVEHYAVFKKMVSCRQVHRLPLLIVTGVGIPRLSTRRFLHLLNKTCGIPIYIFADNDPWGYYIFSLLKRGAISPTDQFPYAAVSDTRYLGLRAGDLLCPEASFHWKPHWANQIRAMKKYACFASKPWQFELSRFEKQKFKIESSLIMREVSANKVVDFLANRLSKEEYLAGGR